MNSRIYAQHSSRFRPIETQTLFNLPDLLVSSVQFTSSILYRTIIASPRFSRSCVLFPSDQVFSIPGKKLQHTWGAEYGQFNDGKQN
jgi:hypothetical protein